MTEATDIVERLRKVDISWSETGELCALAADEITRLRTPSPAMVALVEAIRFEPMVMRAGADKLEAALTAAKQEMNIDEG